MSSDHEDTEEVFEAAPLAKTNASKFRWPPDPHQVWTYKPFPPAEFVLNTAKMLGKVITQEQLCDLVLEGAHNSPAYAEYANKYREEFVQVCGAPKVERYLGR